MLLIRHTFAFVATAAASSSLFTFFGLTDAKIAHDSEIKVMTMFWKLH